MNLPDVDAFIEAQRAVRERGGLSPAIDDPTSLRLLAALFASRKVRSHATT